MDPLADKYPGISPYAYCAWNPIKFVDPDGKRVGIIGAYTNADGTTSSAIFHYGEVKGVRGFYCNGQRLENGYAYMATEAIGKIHDGGKYGKMLVDAVVNDDRTIFLINAHEKNDGINESRCVLNKLFWNVADDRNGDYAPSFITLSHEFGHFLTYWHKLADYGTWYDKVTNDEKLVVNMENLIRNENYLDPRKYYEPPSKGEIPQLTDRVKKFLETISNNP